MIITTANYTKIDNSEVRINESTLVPVDPQNRVYKLVLKWVEVGGVIEAYDADNSEHNAKIVKEIEELDIASIAEIRAYIAGLPDAPQTIKDKESEAQVKKAKLK